jgi:hypothetical protein
LATPIFSRVLRGYLGIFKAVGFILALLGASAGLGFLVAWPLWFFATSSRLAYSIFTTAVLCAGVAYFVFNKIRRRQPRGYGRPGNRRPLGAAALILLWVVLLAAGAYLVILLALRGMYILAIPVSILLLAALGYIAYAASAGGKAGDLHPKKQP